MRNDLQEFIKLRLKLTEEKTVIEKRLGQINEALGEMGAPAVARSAPAAPGKRGGKRQMSAEARARIAEAQHRRWAAQKAGEGKAAPAAQGDAKPKRKMSAAGRRAISEAAKRRWATARASGQNKL